MYSRVVKMNRGWVLFFAWIAVALLYLWVRYSNTPGVLTPDGVIFPDTDPYYRLHRIESLARGSLSYPLHDPDLQFPDGFDVPWPLGLDLLLAIPLRLMGLVHRAVVEAVCAVSIPVLSLPTLGFVAGTAVLLAGGEAGLPAALLLSFSVAHRQVSQIGHLDHHFLEAAFLAAAFFLFLLRRNSPRTSFLGLLAVCAFAPGFWPQAWVLSLFLAAGWLAEARRESFARQAAFFVLSGTLSLIPLACSDRFTSGYFSLIGFSWWTPVLYFLLGAGFFALHVGSERPLSLRGKIVAVSLIAAGLCVFLLGSEAGRRFWTEIRNAGETLFPTSGILSVTLEARPPWRLPAHRWPELLPLTIPWFWLLLKGWKESRGAAAFSIGPLILSLFQLRFVPMAAPVTAVWTAVAILHVGSMLRKPRIRGAVWAGMTLALVLPGVPMLRWTAHGPANPFYWPVWDAATFLRDEASSTGEAKEKRAIAAPWNYGHWLLYESGLPVVADPFQGAGGSDVYALLLSRDQDALETFARRRPARFLFAEAPTYRVERWYRALGIDPTPFVRITERPLRRLTRTMPAFEETLLFRLFDRWGERTDGTFPDRWRLMFVSSYASPENPRVPALKVFERVVGARLEAPVAFRGSVLEAEIHTLYGSFVFRSAPVDAGDHVEWRVPYAEVRRGGLYFDGRYSLTCPDGKRRKLSLVVREEDVLRGRTLRIK